MKNCNYICGILGRINLTLLGAGIFISAYIGCRNLGLPIPDGFCTVRSEIVLAKEGDSAALSLYSYYNFSFMARTTRNCKDVQGTSKATSAHDTSVATIQLPIISNPYSIPCFEDFIAEAMRRFNVEKDAKNQAYSFILSNGLLDQFSAFCKTYHSDDPHQDCIEYLTNQKA